MAKIPEVSQSPTLPYLIPRKRGCCFDIPKHGFAVSGNSGKFERNALKVTSGNILPPKRGAEAKLYKKAGRLWR